MSAVVLSVNLCLSHACTSTPAWCAAWSCSCPLHVYKHRLLSSLTTCWSRYCCDASASVTRTHAMFSDNHADPRAGAAAVLLQSPAFPPQQHFLQLHSRWQHPPSPVPLLHWAAPKPGQNGVDRYCYWAIPWPCCRPCQHQQQRQQACHKPCASAPTAAAAGGGAAVGCGGVAAAAAGGRLPAVDC